MLKKIKSIIRENRQLYKVNHKLQRENLLQLKELEWAHIYHDSIRGNVWLENLPLNIGRWAGNYAFFYVLHRVLNDCKPVRILEFGLGESSKFISAYLNNELKNTTHLIIEQDSLWYSKFLENNTLNKNTSVEVCSLVTKDVQNYQVNSYENLEDKVTSEYDLYVVDGPFGSEHFSRYDIVRLMLKIEKNDDFIIIMDDYQRQGEKETVNELLSIFKEKGILTYTGVYTGNKSVCVIATEKYKHLKSL